MDFLNNIKIIFTDIKIAHTIFAMPFAVMSAFLAAEGMPELGTFMWILVAMFSARNSAMAFNRIADVNIDRLNPRTKDRALPSGKSTAKQYWVFLILSSFVFIFLIKIFANASETSDLIIQFFKKVKPPINVPALAGMKSSQFLVFL